MDETVWARDPAEGFFLGRITELLEDGAEVTPLETRYVKSVLPFSDIFRAYVENDKDYDDNCEYFDTLIRTYELAF